MLNYFFSFLILEILPNTSKFPIEKNNPLHFLRIINNIASAINKLRARSQYRPLKFVSEKHLKIIGDKSHIFHSNLDKDDHLKMLMAKSELKRFYYKWKIWWKKRRTHKIIFKSISKDSILVYLYYFNFNLDYLSYIYEEKMPVIHPDHFWKIIWDFFIIFLFLFLFFSYPIQISFKLSCYWIENYFYIESGILDIIIFIMYGLNCLIKLN